MHQTARFVDTPNGPIVVVDVDPLLLFDEVAADRYRRKVSRTLGGCQTLLRCQVGSGFLINGEQNLRRFAVDPIVDTLPAVDIDFVPDTRKAA